MKRTFEFNDDKSSKFWSIEVNGSEFTVNYGKIGTDGQLQTKSFADEAACIKEAEKLIAEKTKKGYAEQGEASAAKSNPWPHLEGMLAGDPEALKAHFAPWALTDDCKQALAHIAENFRSCTCEEGVLTLTFEGGYDDEIEMTFDQPVEAAKLKNVSNMKKIPQSYKDVVLLHNGFCIGDGAPDYPSMMGIYNGEVYSELPVEELLEDEDNAKNYVAFGEAGQNWWAWDLKRKNKLGEPLMLLADHGMNLEETDAIDGQNEWAFGVGGLIIRAMGHAIFTDDDYFDDYGWG